MTECRHCGGALARGEVDGRSMLVCLACGADAEYVPKPAVPRRGTVLDRLNAQRECEVVEAIERAILSYGGHVLRVGQRKAKGSGTTPGCPDLFAWVPGLPGALWVGLEVKRPGGRIRPEQLQLAHAGRIRIVDSVPAALEALGLGVTDAAV